MATNVKKVQVVITGEQAKLIVRALDVVQDQIKRAIAKESDDVVKARREAQIAELRNLANVILYDGKELV